MKIDVIDMDDPVLGNSRRAIVRNSGSEIIEMYGMCNGIGQMVTDIKSLAPPASIEVLRIWGHGWAGGQLIAAGHDSQTGVDEGSALWQYNLTQYAPQLQTLRDRFRGDGHVELKGCQVASGPEGEKFLASLAKILGVPVIGAVDIQGGLWVAGQHWNGPLVEAEPNGALSCAAWTPL